MQEKTSGNFAFLWYRVIHKHFTNLALKMCKIDMALFTSHVLTPFHQSQMDQLSMVVPILCIMADNQDVHVEQVIDLQA